MTRQFKGLWHLKVEKSMHVAVHITVFGHLLQQLGRFVKFGIQ